MDVMKAKPDLLDVVELRTPHGSHHTGSVGVVVELFPTEALVEIANEHGETIELISAPFAELHVRSSEVTGRRAAG
jgi:hypothetical protein